MDTLGGGGDQFVAVEDRVHEALRDHGVPALPRGDGDLAIPGRRSVEAACGGLRKLARADFVAPEPQGVTLVDEPPAVAGNLEAVGAGGLAGGRDEHGRRAAVILEVRGDLVLGLDVVVLAEVAERAHARRHAEKPLEQVKIVGALIEQDAAAFALPGGAPAARRVVCFGPVPRRDDPADPLQVPQLASIKELLELLEGRARTQLKHRRENLAAALLVRGNEALTVRLVDRDGLLNQDVQALLEGVNADRRVVVVRRRDDDSVDLTRADEVPAVRIGLEALERREPFRIDVADGRQLSPLDLPFAQVSAVRRPHAPNPDDADSDRIHRVTPQYSSTDYRD